MLLLKSKEFTQYFTDCTYKFLSYEIKENTFLLIMLGYNCVIDIFQLILITILSNESSDIYTEFYNYLKNLYNFRPKKLFLILH